MSETQVLVKTVNDDDDDDASKLDSAAQAADNDEDEDLEDGEIDDDDDDDNDAKSSVAAAQRTDKNNENVNKINSLSSSIDEKTQNKQHDSSTKSATDIITIDLAYENSSSPITITTPSSLLKSKKSLHIEDDHASSIENALANVLKKKGIDPIMPKVLESRNGHQDAKDKDVEVLTGQGQSRSSRRRKRKKQRDDKDKDKDRKEKKKNRYDSPEPSGAPPLDDGDDMDDYEMLNVRGGSPPPITATTASAGHQAYGASYKDSYDSAVESCSSYDSFESQGDAGGAGDGGSRRRRRAKKDRKRRSGRNRDDDRNRSEKRSRRDSGDDKHRQEPRKLELCKFYLMECCAKKEKCSYMHKDFPCKYYYLGMECVLNDACKFSHNEPLSEQLRNILLKHLETAPKEILGNFKRISRENAISLITKRHEELCKKFSVENTWSPIINLPMNHNRNRGGGGGANGDHHNLQQLQQLQQQAQQVQMQQLQQQQLQQQQQKQQQNQMHVNIPSLLDMVINPPIVGGVTITPNSKADKQRKSRWADTSSGSCVESSSCKTATTSAVAAPPPPSYLDLKNLTGILSAEHIDKLSQLGIVNLKQVDKLTFGQLNQIGLTIAEISEIQLNAINMAKLGVTSAAGSGATAAETGASTNQKVAENSIPTNRDVDMRFLPSATATTTATTTTATTTTTTTSKDTSDATTNSLNAEKDNFVSSNSNSNSSNPVVMVDYTQYLKDSNLSFDRSDAYDDEKDEEQLVIDDDNTDDEENAAASSNLENSARKEEKQKDNSFINELLPPRLQMTDIVSTLKNPFNKLYAPSLTTNEIKAEKEKETLKRESRDPRSVLTDLQRRNPFKAYKDDSADDSNQNNSDEDYDNRYQLPSLGRSNRSRSRTPSQSSTPEASQSPEPQDNSSAQPMYDRRTMYDFSARQAEEDELKRVAKSIKSDKDMRFLQGGGGGTGSDIDLRLPFQPVTNYTPATEIDGSITSHLPMTYKVYVVAVPAVSYTELRKTFKSDQTVDPRLRRILGLPELSQTKTSAALSRTVRKLSNSIPSPSESEGASPKYYTPPSSVSDERKSSVVTTAAQPRMDPRRAAAAAAVAASSSATSSTSTNNSSASSSGAIKQNVEIRNLLQKSEWYKNLNSKFKIMVNQQLAVVSTELKKFHQDDSPNKIFDITFIVTNSTLQQILTHLGIFINDNGEVEHVDPDIDEPQISSNTMGIALPNLSQPPPQQQQQQQQQLNFLRAPPPNMAPPHLFRQGTGPPPSMNMAPFGPPPNARPSLLGLPPGATAGNPFNPFAGNMPDMGVGMNPNFVGGPGGGPGLIGAGPIGFGNFGLGMPPNMQQRNFNLGGGGGNQQRGHRNQNRRNNFNGGGGNNL